MRATRTPGQGGLEAVDPRAADMRPSLLRALTELYVQKGLHTTEEERQFVELALRLIDAVDAATCGAVARSLANYAGAPREVLRRLASKEDKSAGPYRTDAVNKIDAVTLTQQFFSGSTNERADFLAKLTADGVSDSPLAASKKTIDALEANALAGRASEFIGELERSLGIARPLAQTIVADRSGEPLVVAAKALAVPLDVLQRILLFINPAIGHSVVRVFRLSVLFNQISEPVARRLVAAWRTAGETKPAGAHADAPRSNIVSLR